MYRAIMVPLDGSSFGEHALPFAVSLAHRSGAEIHLIHVHVAAGSLFMEGMPALDVSLDTQNRAREQAYLDELARRMAASENIAVTMALLDGAVAETLQAYAATHRIDLVVMTTHGRGALSRLWLGNVADRLVRHAPVPVLLVRPQEIAIELVHAPVPRHMLLPLDGSALSEQALAHAVALGTLTQAEYTLLRVVEPMFVGYGTELYGAEIEQQTLVELRADAQSYLDRVAARMRLEALRVRTAAVIGLPAQSILEYAHAHAVDAIAMTTHGRSGTARLILGSVADKVVRGATVPVLIYRPHGQSAEQ